MPPGFVETRFVCVEVPTPPCYGRANSMQEFGFNKVDSNWSPGGIATRRPQSGEFRWTNGPGVS